MNGNGSIQVGLAVSSSSLLFAITILSAFLGLAIIVSLMKIYKKCGKPAISAIVPIWSQIVLFQIADIPFWWIFIPVANVIYMIKAYIVLAKKFGKGTGFAVGMIFLPMIFIPLLAFSEYEGSNNKNSEPIYNPFNQTGMAQVMPSAPIGSGTAEAMMNTMNNGVVHPTTVENVSVVESVVEPVAAAPVTITNPEPESVNPLESMDMNNTNLNNYAAEVFQSNDVVVEEPPVMENVQSIPEVNVIDGILPAQENVAPSEQNVGLNTVVEPEGEYNNIQDVSLYSNSVVEAKDIAFGGSPVLEPPVMENLASEEPIQTLEVTEPVQLTETLNVNAQVDLISDVQTNNENVITSEDDSMEMPEIATKSCPACGVSLAEDTKFCVACGTQL